MQEALRGVGVCLAWTGDISFPNLVLGDLWGRYCRMEREAVLGGHGHEGARDQSSERRRRAWEWDIDSCGQKGEERLMDV